MLFICQRKHADALNMWGGLEINSQKRGRYAKINKSAFFTSSVTTRMTYVDTQLTDDFNSIHQNHIKHTINRYKNF